MFVMMHGTLNPCGFRTRWRTVGIAACLSFVAVAGAAAQSAGGNLKRRNCVDCEAESRRAKALDRLDSLRWFFENERLTEPQREHLRREMTLVIRDLQASLRDMNAHRADLERAARDAREASALERAARDAWEASALDRAAPDAWDASAAVAAATGRRPGGYLGVSFDGPNMEEHRRGEWIIRFFAHPRVALVEPGSPAERAGIRQGDTLLALNGRSVIESDISLTRLLVPNEHLSVRVRRGDAVRDFNVRVGRAPDYVIRRTAPSPAVAPVPRPAQRVATRPRRPAPASAPTPPPAPMPPAANAWIYRDGVAGARVETVTPGLGRALGVASGVLVVQAAPGTPAHDAGLRDGDVILRAADQSVTSVRELRRILERAVGREDGVKVELLRERKRRELTLRW